MSSPKKSIQAVRYVAKMRRTRMTRMTRMMRMTKMMMMKMWKMKAKVLRKQGRKIMSGKHHKKSR